MGSGDLGLGTARVDLTEKLRDGVKCVSPVGIWGRVF